MKPEVMNAVLTAKLLFDSCRPLCTSRDRYMASAGLIILQDGFEIVLYAALLELDKDTASLDKLTFDQLIGNLAKYGFPLERSGTLKAMNKMRVQVKHYAQVADAVTVEAYYQACRVAVDALLTKVVGQSLQEIVIEDAIEDEDVRTAVAAASTAISNADYGTALKECRKILFFTVEREYDIAEWKDYQPGHPDNHVGIMMRRHFAAPYHTRNAKWISENVSTPTDYIQIDPERLRVELLEMGIDRVEFENVSRLTPKVYPRDNGEWAVEYKPDLPLTEHVARYCLDLAVSVALKQQMRAKLNRWGTQMAWRITVPEMEPLRASPDKAAAQIGELVPGKPYKVSRVVPSLNDQTYFAEVAHLDSEDHSWISGYVPITAGELTEFDWMKDG